MLNKNTTGGKVTHFYEFVGGDYVETSNTLDPDSVMPRTPRTMEEAHKTLTLCTETPSHPWGWFMV